MIDAVLLTHFRDLAHVDRLPLSVLLGEDAKGLSANVASRLKAQWADEHASLNQRGLSPARYVYWWVESIHMGLRSEGSDGQCLLVIIGVTPDGRRERVAIGDGYRESKASWAEVLLDLKSRGLQAGPLAGGGDGAVRFSAALEEMFPATRAQRCRFHKMGNVLNALPESQHGRAKADLQAIWMAATSADASAGGRELPCSSVKLNVGQVGQPLENEAQRAMMMMAAVTAPPRSSPFTGTPVGLQIDAGYIKAPRQEDGKRWTPVVASKLIWPKTPCTHAHAYAVGHDPSQGLRQQAFLQSVGIGPQAPVTVISNGGDDISLRASCHR